MCICVCVWCVCVCVCVSQHVRLYVCVCVSQCVLVFVHVCVRIPGTTLCRLVASCVYIAVVSALYCI